MVDKKIIDHPWGSQATDHMQVFALVKTRPANLYIWVLVYLVNQIIIFQNIPLDAIKKNPKN